jgi:hypothetical protein
MKNRPLTRSLLLVLCLAAPLQAQTPQSLFRDWRQEHITHINPSEVRHADLKIYLDRLRAEGIPVNEVGRSVAGREIYQMEFGKGPLKVFMWSQMHGDEPTATSALIDLFNYLQKHRRDAWVSAIEKKITLRAVPMLNPDGAELYQRRNLQFIDINRDARELATPEGRLLKKLRDDWSPEIGFNLHNQYSRTSVGTSGLQATISLLAVASDAAGSDTPGRIRNKKICAVIVEALAPYIYGHVGRYDDTFNPRAFGDLFSLWGTPTVLIETGELHGKSEMDLVQLNFIAFAAALHALADGSIEEANPAVYDALRYNTSGLIYSLIIRNATVVNRFPADQSRTSPFKADIAINEDAGRSGGKPQLRASVQDVGDMYGFRGLEEVDAGNYFVVIGGGGGGVVRPGAEATLLFYEKKRAPQLDWTAQDLETRFPPDAKYQNGQWTGREKLTVK